MKQSQVKTGRNRVYVQKKSQIGSFFVFSHYFFANSAIFLNTSGLFSAIDARTLRSSRTFNVLRALMNLEYESPFRRAPALIFVFQSCRNVRFFARRSRNACIPA